MLRQQKKYRERHRHDLEWRVRCVLRHILIAETAERMPQAMRLQSLSAGGIGDDSWGYDISPETPESLDFALDLTFW